MLGGFLFKDLVVNSYERNFCKLVFKHVIMKIYKPTDKFVIGKNFGYTLAEVYKYQPSYIEWAILNLDDFKINLSEFEALPAPTTLSYEAKHFEPEIKKLEFTEENLSEIFSNTDFLNGYKEINVKHIIEQIQNGAEVKVLENFRFAEIIYKTNNSK